MHTPDTREAVREKGFWRRNWLVLGLCLSVALCSAFNCSIRLDTAERSVGIHILNGSIGMDLCEVLRPGVTSIVWGYDMSFHPPMFGTGTSYLGFLGGFLAIVPLWMPFAVTALWIVFREWRRHRRARA